MMVVMDQGFVDKLKSHCSSFHIALWDSRQNFKDTGEGRGPQTDRGTLLCLIVREGKS